MAEDLSNEKPIDFVIVGLGNPGPEFQANRHNAGFIFIDYLSNCVALQSYLITEVQKRREEKLLKKKEENESDSNNNNNKKKKSNKVLSENGTKGEEENEEELVLKDIKGDDGFPKYQVPNFTRSFELGADIHDVLFALTEESVNEKKKANEKKKLEDDQEVKKFRLILVKPKDGINESGRSVRRVLKKFNLEENFSKKLIVVFDDFTVLPGSISIQDGPDTRSSKTHNGLDSVVQALNTTDFIRFRIGIGAPPTNQKSDDYVLENFQKENREMDMLGFSLDLTAQALQLFASTNDLSKAKKKFGKGKKLPSNLRK
ncbi:hypothetical protein HDU92_007877, partial [Lobulomyces angularis]